MRKKSYKIILRLFFSIAVLLISFQSSFVSAEKFSQAGLVRFLEARNKPSLNPYGPDSYGPSTRLPEGAFICDGQVVIAPTVIKRQLYCEKNRIKKHYYAGF